MARSSAGPFSQPLLPWLRARILQPPAPGCTQGVSAPTLPAVLQGLGTGPVLLLYH